MAGELKRATVGTVLTQAEYEESDGSGIVLDSQAQGDIIRAVDASTLGRLGIGAASAVLTSDGNDPTWTAGLTNSHIAAAAAIAHSKLAALTSARILVGNGSNVPTAVAISGDISLANDGVVTIAELAVSKLADGAARQVLQTDPAGTGVEWTDDIDLPGTLDVTGQATFDAEADFQDEVTQEGNGATNSGFVRGIFSKTDIVDNTATSIFTITTVNESGSADGGGYYCTVKGVIGHRTGGDPSAVKGFMASFARSMAEPGTAGVNTAVTEIHESAQAGNNTAVRGLGTVTMTVVETTEYVMTIQFTIDLTGSGVDDGEVCLSVELEWINFLTPPTLAAA